jgi:hypothetical protein
MTENWSLVGAVLRSATDAREAGLLWLAYQQNAQRAGRLEMDSIVWTSQLLAVTGSSGDIATRPGQFRHQLIEAALRADVMNVRLLAHGYPELMGAVLVYKAVENGLDDLTCLVRGAEVLVCGCLAGYVSQNKEHLPGCSVNQTAPEGC